MVCRRHEQGAAVLLVLMVLLLAGISFFLAGRSGNLSGLNRQRAVTRAMALAKNRLLAYTVMYADNYPASGAGPGHLPCPDTSNNGSPNPPCGPGAMGRLPRAIPLPSGEMMPISDHGEGYDQRFWYALSSQHRNNPAGPVNSETIGGLQLDGSGDVVAVLIAPGMPIAGQNRPGLAAVDYLEGANATGPPAFASSGPGDFNDRVLAIRGSDFMPLVERRVLGVLADLIRRYRAACGQYPWPAPYADPRIPSFFAGSAGTLAGFFPLLINNPANPGQDEWDSGCATGIQVPAWLAANNWQRLSFYALAGNPVQAGGECTPGGDCLTVQGLASPGNQARVVLLLAGAELVGQDRAAFSGPWDYFEGENAGADHSVFEVRVGKADFNDQLLIVY